MSKKPKILFITREAPFGKHEAFIIQELLKVREFFEIIIVPVIPRFYPQYADARELLKDSIIMPLINPRILIGFLMFFISNPHKVLNILGDILRESRSIKVFLRNLSIVPKAVYMSSVLKNAEINHIHAHWATIQTTFGLIISRILGVPFSFTAHRYDIGENNMLGKKV
ncbi:MAG: colanic acid biosynthesis glycosyltransferase WcaL, partial [Nitrososphaerota archaeon]